MGKISNILTSDPPVLLGQFSHWALLKSTRNRAVSSISSATARPERKT